MLPIDLQILKYLFFEKPIYSYKIRPYRRQNAYHKLYRELENYQSPGELLHQPLDKATYTIFDLETTGFLPEIGHEIISIGAIQIEGLQSCHIKKFHQIIRPIRPVRRHTLDLTGLTRTQLKNGASFIEGFDRFLSFSNNSILVAHPAKFDMRFLRAMLKRWQLPDFNPPVIDSQLVAQWLLPEIRHQLDPLLRYFDIEQMERHHALNDAIMTAELFEQLLKGAIESGAKDYYYLQKQLESLDPSKKKGSLLFSSS
ncbi:hypothetical protein GCM10007216_22430 [Thalassobacillus devorans]|uniref:Exonuclease domain-containing protein n=1 Tax=Thalassobacillus devorans TaxID=279813 RepID=A0ABQ1P548_9BACI|nr:3'-5' exonuclease [Thalassobacillus devorans]NIK29583.1 DNA polymerase-3 subunit epsilon [Thalassobacillus devorans]GGC91198.1 hypothetical protein GCM10007216_22430 [Thalassobacillus devorans]